MRDRKEYQKNFYLKNKEKILLRSKEWKLKNKERIYLVNKEYKLKNKEKIKLKQKEYRLKHIEKIKFKQSVRFLKRKNFIDRVKLKFGCKHCGYKENAKALHFDHIDRNNKTNQIGQLTCCSIERLKNEMRKCQILCANCHAIKTYREEDYKHLN